jgi:predicted transcriptional regulator
MNVQDKSLTMVVDKSADSLDELSEYLDVLSSSVRLKILKIVEKKPSDARSISHEIETSYENTKKHLDKLLSIGVIKKEAGLGSPTSKGIHPVWEYSLVPGGLETIIRNLGLFSNKKVQILEGEMNNRLTSVKGVLSKEVLGNMPAAIVLGGAMDGKVFLLKKEMVNIGRADTGNTMQDNTADDIVLPDEYSAVTRISHPHGRLAKKKGEWYIEDCGSTGGTSVNNRRIEEREHIEVHDGDIIEFSKGVNGVTLLMIIPKREPEASQKHP